MEICQDNRFKKKEKEKETEAEPENGDEVRDGEGCLQESRGRIHG